MAAGYEQPWGAGATQLWKARITIGSDRRVTMEVIPLPYEPGSPGAPGTPAQYGHAATDPGLYPVSEDPWNGGRYITRAATLDGTYGYQRPTIHQNIDRWGNVVSISDPRSANWVTTYRYNANNQLIEQVQGGGLVTSVYYDALGRQVAVRDANGHVNGQEWDAGGNLVRELHADGGVVNHAYDAFGNRTLVIDAMGHPTWYVYDKRNQLVRTTYANGIQEHQRWDAAGRLVSTTNGENETTRYAYDLRGNLVRSTLAMGQVTEYAYDAHNRKIFERDANGNTASWRYDYFGALTGHTDLGGATYSYSYDNARQLTAQSNTRGQNQVYTYDAAGQLVHINEFLYYHPVSGVAIFRDTYYRYDLAGRHIRETTVQNGETYQDNHIAYDELGRMRWVADGRVTVTIDYDAVGNRTHVGTRVNDLVGYARDSYYQYDQMNRQTVVDAVDQWGNLGGQGHALEYDLNGNRIKDTSAAGVETYEYDRLNRLSAIWLNGNLTDHRQYDNANRVVQSGNASEGRFNAYDHNGRLIRQDVLEPFKAHTVVEYTYDNVGNVLTSSTTLVGEVASFTQNTVVPLGEGYQIDHSLTIGYGVANSRGGLGYAYDANGQLWSVGDAGQTLAPGLRIHDYITDAAGNVLYSYYTDESHQPRNNAQRQLVVNGEVLGRYGDVVTGRILDGKVPTFSPQVDFSFGYQPINGNYPSGSPGTYAVGEGDTLQTIAKGAYGDASLWYLIAEANGLGSDLDLRAGQILSIPTRVQSANNVETFKPYDPSKVVDSPTMMALPGSKGGCGGFGQILVAIVVVVVAVVSQQYYLANFATATGTTAAGAAVYSTGSYIAAGAIGGAVGSVAGQSVGIAIGAQDSFSWKGVALSAIGGGVSAGLGGNIIPSTENVIFDAAIRGATANALTQGIAVATGLQSSFNWRSVAISAVSAGATRGLQSATGYDPGLKFELDKSIATSIGAGATTQLAVNGRINAQQLATDAFGNVIGDALARGSTSGGAGEKAIPGPVSASERQTIMGYFADGPTDNALRVNGLTFSQGAALRRVESNPHGLPTYSEGADTPANASSATNRFDDGFADFLAPEKANLVSGAYGLGSLVNTQYGGVESQRQPAAALTAQDYKAQADKLMKDAYQLQDAEQWARSRGLDADANNYRTAAQQAFYASNSASMQAANTNVESSRNISSPASTSPFASGWNTGEYSAGTPYASGSRAPDYVSIQLNAYVASAGVAIDLHDGGVYGQWALGRQYPAYTAKPGLSIVGGSIAGGVGAGDTAEFLKGGSWAAGAFAPSPVPLIGVGGGVNHSYGGKTAIEIGVSIPPGAGVNPAGYGFELKNSKAK